MRRENRGARSSGNLLAQLIQPFHLSSRVSDDSTCSSPGNTARSTRYSGTTKQQWDKGRHGTEVHAILSRALTRRLLSAKFLHLCLCGTMTTLMIRDTKSVLKTLKYAYVKCWKLFGKWQMKRHWIAQYFMRIEYSIAIARFRTPEIMNESFYF